MLVTPGQIKAARAMLDWSAEDLGKRVGVVKTTISAIETGRSNGSVEVLGAIVKALESGGIEFLPDGGVRPRQGRIVTLHGQSGYWDFYDDVYETVKEVGGEILVSNVDERDFDKWLGEKWGNHRNRMSELLKTKAFNLKILIKEGDRHFTVPGHAEYRWTPKERFSEIPFYVYGQKLAIILFEPNNVSVHVIDNPKITEAYKKQFDVIWEQAIIIPKDQITEQAQYEAK